MEIPTGAIIAVIVTLSTAIGILYRQTVVQQKQIEILMSETKVLMGGLTELVRTANSLMNDVRTVMVACQARHGGRDED